MCNWSEPTREEEFVIKDVNKEQHANHVYQLADNKKVKKRVDELWKELDMDTKDKKLSKKGPKEIYKILERHISVFTDKDVKVGCTDWVKMEIRIQEDARPVCAKVRPLSKISKDNLKQQLNLWLKDGVILLTESPWGSPLVPVAKKDGRPGGPWTSEPSTPSPSPTPSRSPAWGRS